MAFSCHSRPFSAFFPATGQAFSFLQTAPGHGQHQRGKKRSFGSLPHLFCPDLCAFPLWRVVFMSIHAIVPPFHSLTAQESMHDSPQHVPQFRPTQLRTKRGAASPIPFHLPPPAAADEGAYRQAELFYLQKQIQSQTPMVIVLEDGEHVEGCIEWYDRNCLKVRGRNKTLVYKSAVKYMYKLGEQGQ
jgi:sRNA-binding regulator protein Hfq